MALLSLLSQLLNGVLEARAEVFGREAKDLSGFGGDAGAVGVGVVEGGEDGVDAGGEVVREGGGDGVEGVGCCEDDWRDGFGLDAGRSPDRMSNDGGGGKTYQRR